MPATEQRQAGATATRLGQLQAEHAALRAEYEKLRAENAEQRAEYEKLRAENAEQRAGYEKLRAENQQLRQRLEYVLKSCVKDCATLPTWAAGGPQPGLL